MARVLVRELIAWDLDDDVNRPIIDKIDARIWQAQREIWRRPPYSPASPVLIEETRALASQLEDRIPSIQSSGEFSGLQWSLAVVDLRKILGFQRRLCFDVPLTDEPSGITFTEEDLLDLTLPEESSNESPSVVRLSETEIEIRSGNPNLRVEFASLYGQGQFGFPLQTSYGSPYMEVARYQDRWFLRDGYHRAYKLLKAGVYAVPVVVAETNTLEELGAVHPWFFSDEVLFSEYPPLLLDYQYQKLVIEYERPAREKVIRLSLHESYELSQEDVLQAR
jgi:hypothetical protein